MTDIYVVLVQDRRCGPEVKLFSSGFDAMDYAEKELAEGSRNRPEEITRYELSDRQRAEGDMLHATYSCEGDSVTVTKQKVQ